MRAAIRLKIAEANIRHAAKQARSEQHRRHVISYQSATCLRCGLEKVIGDTGLRYCLFCPIERRNPAMAEAERERDRHGIDRLNEPIRPGEFGDNRQSTMTGCALSDFMGPGVRRTSAKWLD